MVHLGPVYGSVKVEGLTVDEAEKAVETHLKGYSRDENGQPVGLKNPQVSVELPDVAGRQQISGEHLVRPDGTVSLGVFGGVYVAGMTLAEVKQAIEVHLSEHIHDPEVSVDVLAYNSKTYYVITDGGGFGEQVVRLPCTGNETVLDAISQIDGLSEVSSKTIWLARPAPSGVGCAQIMDVHWRDIAAEGITTTNYQILPGDRIYIKADKLITTDNFISKVIAPAERIMGFILLGSGVQSTLRFIHINNRGGGFGGGGF
jgi:protein involved in polysaccharide export with SLBB domain